MAKTFSGRDDDRPAVAGVSLRVAPGEVFGIIGESGAGKSTLVRLINLLERPTAGQVRIDGRDLGDLSGEELRAQRRRIGMIFQHFNLLSSQTVAQNVAFPLRLEGHLRPRDVRARVLRLLARFGLEPFADRYPSELSGGQKQRVGIARALACEPTILLCDEPTSALDPETTEQILGLLDELNRELGLTVVIITHEMDVVRRVCDRVAVLDHGAVVESGDVADVFLNAEHPATRRLLREDATPPPARAPGARTFRLTWRGEVAHVPFLSRISRETGVDLCLQAARVAKVKGEPYGQLTLSMTGREVAAAVTALQAAGVRVQELPL